MSVENESFESQSNTCEEGTTNYSSTEINNWDELFDKIKNFTELELFHYRPFILSLFNSFNKEQKDYILNKYNELIIIPYKLVNSKGKFDVYINNNYQGDLTNDYFELIIGQNDIEELKTILLKNKFILQSVQIKSELFKSQLINVLENYFNSKVYFMFNDDLLKLIESIKLKLKEQSKLNININNKLADKIALEIELKN